jgi:4-hydroxy-tetrahydrodipicolinate synthase
MLNQILYTACVTPFEGDDCRINYQDLKRLLHLQSAAGNGVVLLGSTGEGLSLTDMERRQLVEFACGLQLPIKIIVGVPSHNLYAALEWLEFCKAMPIDGYLMTTPIYTKPGIIGQTKWFEKLLDKAAHPAMLYNIPGRAGVALHYDSVRNLQGHARFKAIKDSSGDHTTVTKYKAAASNIAVYCGDDYMMQTMAEAGAVGLVSIASNAWPEAVRAYVEESLRQPYLRSTLAQQIGRDLLAASNPIPIKALMKDIGLISQDKVRLPLSMDDLPSRQTLLDHHARTVSFDFQG